MNELTSDLRGFRVLNSKLEHDCNITNRSQVHLTGHFITTVFRFALHNLCAALLDKISKCDLVFLKYPWM